MSAEQDVARLSIEELISQARDWATVKGVQAPYSEQGPLYRRLADELDKAQARLQAVLDLHRPIDRRETTPFFPGVFEHRKVCEHCTYWFTDPETDLPVGYVLWPCKTAAGVDGEPT
jgi:hypothetical protein